jgi:hypothetical protein
MLTVVALVAIAAAMSCCVVILATMWRAARKYDNKGSSTDVE